MSGGFLDRIANLLKGAASTYVKELERKNPEAVLQAAIDAQHERYQRSSSLVRTLEGRRRDLLAERVRARKDAQELGERAAEIAQKDESRALALLERKQTRLARAEDVDRELEEVTRVLTDAGLQRRDAKSEYEQLKAEREKLLSKLKSVPPEDARESLEKGVPINAADVALDRLRDNVDRIATETSDREQARKEARCQAQSELENLKRSFSRFEGPDDEPLRAGAGKRTLDVDPVADEEGAGLKGEGAQADDRAGSPDDDGPTDDGPDLQKRTL